MHPSHRNFLPLFDPFVSEGWLGHVSLLLIWIEVFGENQVPRSVSRGVRLDYMDVRTCPARFEETPQSSTATRDYTIDNCAFVILFIDVIEMVLSGCEVRRRAG